MRQVLIFDYDGVIVDSLSIFMKFFFDACKQYGYDNISTEQEFLALFHGNMFEQMINKGMDQLTILNIVNYLKKGLLAHQQEINLFPDIKFVLKKLAIHHKLLISTSNETSVVFEYLKLRKIDGIFDGIYGSDIEPSKVKKIKLIRDLVHENNFTYIGDTVGDIMEAKQANITSVAVTWGWHSKNVLSNAQPDHIAHHPLDLLSLFNNPSHLNID
jgi:phosphoglycolate phosphatase